MSARPEAREFLAVLGKTLTARNVLADLTSLNANTRRKRGQRVAPHSLSPRLDRRSSSSKMEVGFVENGERSVNLFGGGAHYGGWRMGVRVIYIFHSA